MSPKKQPLPLYDHCCQAVANYLMKICDQLLQLTQSSSTACVLYLVKNTLRPHFVSSLPGLERCALIQAVAQQIAARTFIYGMDESIGKSLLFLLMLLLNSGVKCLHIILCCYYGCSDQDKILQLLSKFGGGLERLELSRSSLLRIDKDLLRQVFLTANNLRHLVMRNICNDVILSVVGSTCHFLEILEISNSKHVTDAGIQSLCIQLEIQDTPQMLPHSQQQASSSSSRTMLYRIQQACCLRSSGEDHEQDALFFKVVGNKNELCKTLRVVNISETGITTNGALLLLTHAEKLQSLGEYNQTARTIEMAQGRIIKFLINFVCGTLITAERMEIVARLCPHLDSLTIYDPKFYLSTTPLSNLKSLHLYDLQTNFHVLEDINNFLNRKGHTLKQLHLHFVPEDYAPVVDLVDIAFSCPELTSLECDEVTLCYGHMQLDTDRSTPFRFLRSVQLGRTVHKNVVLNLLKYASNLETLHAYSCPELSDSDIFNGDLLQYPLHLKCFYLYEAPNLSILSVNTVLKHFPAVTKIGNICKWSIDCDSARCLMDLVQHENLDVQILAGSHWYCSQCS